MVGVCVEKVGFTTRARGRGRGRRIEGGTGCKGGKVVNVKF